MKVFQIKIKTLPSEHGQALVLIVLSMVALLGFAALAIDGGMVYSDRRFAQNGSDASSLAGGAAGAQALDNNHVTYTNWSCGNSGVQAAMATARQAAISRASDNAYHIDQNITNAYERGVDDGGVVTECGSQNYGWLDKYIDVHTMIMSTTDTAFAHFVFSGPLHNRVEAVTRIRPRANLALGYAIVALREDCPNTNTGGVHYDGNAYLKVRGGGIFSNACMRGNGSVDVSVEDAGIVCTGSDCYTENGHPSVTPAPEEGTHPLPRSTWYVPPPDCSTVPSRGSHSGGGTIQPGRYTQIRVNSAGDDLVMEPGLYCLSGSFTINGGTVTGSGVTIYITSGDFNSSGNARIVLTAPPASNCTYCPPPIPGMLIYMAEGNTGEVSLLGTSDSEYLGVVYGPDAMIEAGGTGSELSEIHAQLIGDTVKLHGTTDVVINFDDDQSYRLPPWLELAK